MNVADHNIDCEIEQVRQRNEGVRAVGYVLVELNTRRRVRTEKKRATAGVAIFLGHGLLVQAKETLEDAGMHVNATRMEVYM